MRIERHEKITRYDVILDEQETTMLKAIGHLPPYASASAPLSLTGPEILDTFALLYGPRADQVAAVLCREYEGPCFCGAHRSDLV